MILNKKKAILALKITSLFTVLITVLIEKLGKFTPVHPLTMSDAPC